MILNKPEMVLMAEKEAIKQQVDPALVCSVIECVSEWQPARLESASDDLWHHLPASIQEKAERSLMSMRIGLTQFSGPQARQLDYKQGLDELLVPALNLEIGITVLKRSLAQVGGQADRALIIMYGYPIATQLPRIIMKIKPYQIFLANKPAS